MRSRESSCLFRFFILISCTAVITAITTPALCAQSEDELASLPPTSLQADHHQAPSGNSQASLPRAERPLLSAFRLGYVFHGRGAQLRRGGQAPCQFD